jgi:hypothetical protein
LEAIRSMSLTIDLESLDGINIGIAHGKLTLDEIKESAAAMKGLVDGPDVRSLWDLRDASFDLDVAQVNDLADTMKLMFAGSTNQTAFLVSEDLEFGLIRMYEVLRGTKDVRISVFRDRDDAIAWLRKPSP